MSEALVVINEEALMALDVASEKAIAFSKAGLDITKVTDSIRCAAVMVELRKALSHKDIVTQIRGLEGTALGYFTDKDRKPDKYDDETIVNCVTEALMMGLPICGNNFNIIAGRCYVTKNGTRLKLDEMEGLDYQIVPGVPHKSGEGAIVKSEISWTYGKDKGTQELEIPIRVNAGMGADAILGKADRKAAAWLYNRLKGIKINEGDIHDQDNFLSTTAPVVNRKQPDSMLAESEPTPAPEPVVETQPEPDPEAGVGEGFVDDDDTPSVSEEIETQEAVDMPEIPAGPFTMVFDEVRKNYSENELIMYFRQEGVLDDGETLTQIPVAMKKNIANRPMDLVRKLHDFLR